MGLLNLVYKDQPVSLASAGVIAVTLALLLSTSDRTPAPWLLCLGTLASLAARYLAARTYRATPSSDRTLLTWERRFAAGAASTAIFWGAIGFYAYHSEQALLMRGTVALLLGGVIAATSRTLACQPRAFHIYTALSIVPPAVRLFLDGEQSSVLLGGFLMMYAVLMVGLGHSFRTTIAHSFRLQYEVADLAEQLRRDIAVREQTEAALRTSERQVRFTQTALDRAQDLVAIVDHEGNFLHVNASLCRCTGRTVDELAKTKVWAGIVDISEAVFAEKWDAIKRARSLTFEVDLFGREGDRKPLEISASYVEYNDRPAVCAIGRDLSARRAAEEEKGRMQQQLQETQRLESLGVLAGGIAHDFNNLLTAVLGNATLARDSLDQPRQAAEMLTQIEVAANQAAGLCRQMLAYAGRGQLLVEPLDVSSIVTQTAKLLETTVGRRARLQFQLAPRLPLVSADASQLRQIVLNLVHNASEATHRQDGRIVVTTYPIRIDQRLIATARVRSDIPEGPGVALVVADNGGGMNAETLERIFEPFFTTKFAGRGLGLPAVLGIVRSHRALLHVESRIGQGSTFRVVFPVAAPTVKPAAPAPAGRNDRQHGRAFVIDDEEAVRRVAKIFLERIGFVVEAAADGDTALTLLAGDANRFSLLLVDMSMQGKDGVTTLQEMRRRGVTAPALLMSGFSEQQVRERIGSDIAAGFVQKPFTFETLQRSVTAVLQPAAT